MGISLIKISKLYPTIFWRVNKKYESNFSLTNLNNSKAYSRNLTIGPKFNYKYEKPMPKYIKDDMRERSKTFETGKRPILEIPSKLKDNLSFDSEISESFENNTSILDLEIDVYTKKRDKNYRLIKLEEVNH